MANLQFIINHQVIVGIIVNLNFSPIYTYSYISLLSFFLGYTEINHDRCLSEILYYFPRCNSSDKDVTAYVGDPQMQTLLVRMD
jgi:hypothetical protein